MLTPYLIDQSVRGKMLKEIIQIAIAFTKPLFLSLSLSLFSVIGMVIAKGNESVLKKLLLDLISKIEKSINEVIKPILYDNDSYSWGANIENDRDIFTRVYIVMHDLDVNSQQLGKNFHSFIHFFPLFYPFSIFLSVISNFFTLALSPSLFLSFQVVFS